MVKHCLNLDIWTAIEIDKPLIRSKHDPKFWVWMLTSDPLKIWVAFGFKSHPVSLSGLDVDILISISTNLRILPKYNICIL